MRITPMPPTARRYATLQIWWVGLGTLILYGIINAGAADIRLGFMLVSVAAMWPARLWLLAGGGGVPILPIVAIMSLLYYGLPMLGVNYDRNLYQPDAVLRAGIAVALYLGSATLTWWVLLGRSKRSVRQGAGADLFTDHQTLVICLAGLGLGAVFEVAAIQGWLGWTGNAFGVVRAVVYSFSILASYLLGVLLGQGKLRGEQRQLAIALLAITVVLTVSSLFLVRGLMLVAVLVTAYFITVRRLPVILLAVFLPLVYVLHAGKAEMRDQYWDGDSQLTSVLQVPGLYVQWIDRGLTVLAAGSEGQSLVERASLLQMLLLAQGQTPQIHPYLDGETYAFLLPMLVPRFLWPGKPVSQSTMNMLNLRYGLVTLDQYGRIKTAIGWGVIAEGYVNFGYPGVIAVGLLMGAFMGFMERRALGQPALALPTLLAIITMTVLINVEADLTYLVTILWQSFIAVALVVVGLGLRRRRRERLALANMPRRF